MSWQVAVQSLLDHYTGSDQAGLRDRFRRAPSSPRVQVSTYEVYTHPTIAIPDTEATETPCSGTLDPQVNIGSHMLSFLPCAQSTEGNIKLSDMTST